VWLVFAAANLGDLVVQASWGHFTAVVTGILVTITGVAYACALRPRVVADHDGLTVRNPIRDYHVPWRAVRSVDASDWVRVHSGAEPDADAAVADTRTIYCWALFAPARARIKASRRARGTPQTGPLGIAGFRRRKADKLAELAGSAGSYTADPTVDARLPDEARRLASLPAALAIAERLDARARRERARTRRASVALDASATQVTGAWAWWSVAAMIVPALALVIVALT
jgi:hypothetical protein